MTQREADMLLAEANKVAAADLAHVGTCNRYGGFPRAIATEYQGRPVTLWIKPDGHVWRPAA